MARQITVTESPCKLLPTGMSWLDDYRKRTGSPLGTDSYFVRSDAGGMRTQRDSFATLTEARRRDIPHRGELQRMQGCVDRVL